jgi:gallate decarboxylase subunit D
MSDAELMVRRFQVEGTGSSRLDAVCVSCGADLVVVVGGGGRPHVGSVALGISLASLKDPAQRTQSSYLLAVPGHKEEDLARTASQRLTRELRRSVVVTVGIHEDDITQPRIQEYLALFAELVDRIIAAYR